MRIKVLFFGMLKDITGKPEDQLELADGATLGSIFEYYAGRFPRMGQMAGSIVLARNREFANTAAAVRDGDEIAFLPPVSGGSGDYLEEVAENGNLYALTRQPINRQKVIDRVLTGEDGAVVDFEGVVRNNTKGRRTLRLDYECYTPMAIKVLAEIGREIAGQYAITHIALVHRLGRMLIGETSVAVVVTAPHRKAAFEAALEGINRLKRRVPIWKKEHFADGEVWVEGEWDQHAPVVQPH